MYERRIEGFTAETSHHPGTQLVVVRGEVDIATAGAFATALDAACDGGGRVEVDLHDTTFMDSSGLAVLIRARNRLAEAGGDAIVLRRPSGPVRRLLEISGVGTLFAVVDPVEVVDLGDARPLSDSLSGSDGPTRA